MKTITKILIGCGLLIAMSACNDKCDTITYKINEPIIMSTAEFRSSIKVTAEQHKIEHYGKICFYNGYLYIAENGKGIHIIDNRNPQNPAIVGFIELLGNYDMAIRNNTLYADMLTNLVWFDITNPATPVSAGCMSNAFPGALPPVDNEYTCDYMRVYSCQQNSDSVIVGWKLTQRTEIVERKDNIRQEWDYGSRGELWFTGSNIKGSGGSTGINGSMSRFALHKDYLYSVMNGQMTIISLAGETPSKISQNTYISWDVETIFSYKDAMFLGTTTGMIIYSVANPTQPVFCSSVAHIFSCDPVVVENDLAYVTVHSGNMCGQNINELMVIDVSNIMQPRHLVSYTMTCPKGLGIDNGTLFVCDDGLKIFNAANPQTISSNMLAHKKGMNGYDVIPFENTLMMIAEDGIYQYNYSNLNNIQQISKLAFEK
jgi:hypothetical protein